MKRIKEDNIKKCDCECHKDKATIYCSKCVYFHCFGVKEPPRPKPSPLYMREYMKQYYIRKKYFEPIHTR